MSTADTIRFPSHAGGRRQPTFASNSNVSTRNLYCTILDRRKPSLSRFHLKRLKSRTNTQTPSLYHRKALTWCAPTTNCTGYRRRRGTRSRQQANSSRQGHWRRSAHRLSERGWLPGACSLSLYQQGASPLHEEENAELLRKTSRLRDIVHHYNDEAERVIWQVHEVQEAWGNQVHLAAATALSTVQIRWLRPCPRQAHLPLGLSEAWEDDWSREREEETASAASLRSRRTPDAVWIFIKLIGLGSKHMLEHAKK